jgi:hypothetical protein
VKHAVDFYATMMTRLESYADEFARLARTSEQIELARGFSEYVASEADALLKQLTGLAMGAAPGDPPQAAPDPAQRARFQTQDRGNDLGR